MNRSTLIGFVLFFAVVGVISCLLCLMSIGAILYSMFDGSSVSSFDRTTTAIVQTNTAIYTDYVQTVDALDRKATATQRAFETGDYVGAPTRTPDPINLATHQIPLTQTAVHADYAGTAAALDQLATGTAGALFAATPEATPTPAN